MSAMCGSTDGFANEDIGRADEAQQSTRSFAQSTHRSRLPPAADAVPPARDAPAFSSPPSTHEFDAARALSPRAGRVLEPELFLALRLLPQRKETRLLRSGEFFLLRSSLTLPVDTKSSPLPSSSSPSPTPRPPTTGTSSFASTTALPSAIHSAVPSGRPATSVASHAA